MSHRLRALALFALVTTGCSPKPVIVIIENADSEPLQSVFITAGANTKFIGTLAPGKVTRDTLIPDGESIYLYHGVPKKRLSVVEYFSRGQFDSVRAQVTRDSVRNVQRW